MTIKNLPIMLLLSAGFLITGTLGLIGAGVLYLAVALPVFVSARRHRSSIADLKDDEDDVYTSEDFGPRADWMTGSLRSIPLLVLLPAVLLGEQLQRRLASWL